MVSKYVDVEIDLDDFSDDDLLSELKDRGYKLPSYDLEDLITVIFEKRRTGQDYQRDLDNLIYETIGRIS